MSNTPDPREQKLAARLGDGYSAYTKMRTPDQRDALLTHLSTLTIPEQVTVLETALDQPSLAEHAAMNSENVSLKARLAEAEKKLADVESTMAQAVKDATDKALASVGKEVTRLAEARAVEIMARVGQPLPSTARPNGGGEDADKKSTNVVAAVEDMYREKYGIS